jgi:tight adherence protein B
MELGLSLMAAISVALFAWLLIQTGRQAVSNQKEKVATVTEGNLAEMFIFIDPERLWLFSWLAALVVPALVYLATENPVMTIASAIFVLALPKYGVAWLKKRRNQRFESQLPDALLMLSGAMRAGASFNTALESMVKEQKPPLSQEFDLMVREQRVGVDIDTALQHMEKRLPLQDFMMVVSAMRISREVGGNLAEILESLANTLRRKNEMEGKIRALTGQGKMQGIVMSSLPLLMLFVLTKMEPQAMAPLFSTWYGWVTMAVIMVAEILGYLVISKIVNIDV